jgi:pantoate--beta-alanine ligase
VRTIEIPALAAEWSAAQRHQGRRVAFVPTMGALHEGHLVLIQEARQRADAVVASIFVNPLQFNNKEDLERYPRQPDADAAALRDAGCDMLFLPRETSILKAFVPHHYELAGLDQVLEGPSRPGHFQGVANIVERLFHYVRPDKALFGEKDRQQLTIIRHLALQERWPVEIVGLPTVRSREGLALSSRNARLSKEEAHEALVLFHSLRKAQELAFRMPVEAVVEAAERTVAMGRGVSLDYFTIADPITLRPLSDWGTLPEAVALVAAQVGPVRLIDNMVLRR